MKRARQGLLWIAAILAAGYGALFLWRLAVVAPFPAYMEPVTDAPPDA